MADQCRHSIESSSWPTHNKQCVDGAGYASRHLRFVFADLMLTGKKSERVNVKKMLFIKLFCTKLSCGDVPD
jgi:hypothetical protein